MLSCSECSFFSAAGFSKSLDEQLKDVLDVVGSALRRVNLYHADNIKTAKAREQQLQRRKIEEAARLERIRRGVFHDGRLDCVSGNGVMSELGIGDENIEDNSEVPDAWAAEAAHSTETTKSIPNPFTNDISGLPIVILKNYDAKGAAKRESILNVLANWTAALIENQVRAKH